MDSLGEIKELRKTYGFKGVVCEELEEYLDSLETSNKND